MRGQIRQTLATPPPPEKIAPCHSTRSQPAASFPPPVQVTDLAMAHLSDPLPESSLDRTAAHPNTARIGCPQLQLRQLRRSQTGTRLCRSTPLALLRADPQSFLN